MAPPLKRSVWAWGLRWDHNMVLSTMMPLMMLIA
jgi:hypothetical protein